jgi:hypothetical protein
LLPWNRNSRALAPGAPVTTPARLPDDWPTWPDEKILNLRLCDLPVTIAGSALEGPIRTLRTELRARRLRFSPHFWLSSEWFTPDGVPGIAIPFYLAHPRLARLELAQMLEVEGGTPEWCLRILRHEAGHAIDNAFRLRRRRRRPAIFGKSSVPYPDSYTPRPYSRRFVLHLGSWYAQSHPDEDFAETFAVWLAHPPDVWRRRYEGWGALRKLEYVHAIMEDIAGSKPPVTTRALVEPLHRLERTLRQHYAAKRAHYGLEYPNFYDRDLQRLFSTERTAEAVRASTFVRRVRRETRRLVGRWTGTYQYTIDQVLADIITRCDELRLYLKGPEAQARVDFAVMLTVHTMNYLHSGGHRVAL